MANETISQKINIELKRIQELLGATNPEMKKFRDILELKEGGKMPDQAEAKAKRFENNYNEQKL